MLQVSNSWVCASMAPLVLWHISESIKLFNSMSPMTKLRCTYAPLCSLKNTYLQTNARANTHNIRSNWASSSEVLVKGWKSSAAPINPPYLRKIKSLLVGVIIVLICCAVWQGHALIRKAGTNTHSHKYRRCHLKDKSRYSLWKSGRSVWGF